MLTQCDLTLKALNFFYKNLRDQRVYFNLILLKMSYSALSNSFEYPCYVSTAIRNIFSLAEQGSTLVAESDVIF